MSRTKVLVAVSSPWASKRLAPPLVDLLRRLAADAVVAHVAHPKDDDEHESDAKKRGEETLKVLTDALKDAEIAVDSVMLFSNDIAKAILNTAKARDCTLVVLGVSPKGFLKKLFSRDVPTAILKEADLPVMLCPAEWQGVI